MKYFETNSYLILNISELIIVISLLIASIAKRWDILDILIVIIMIIVSGVTIFVILMYTYKLERTISYLIARYGVTASDLLNLIAVIFLPLFFCYIIFIITLAFKIFALYLLYRENKASDMPVLFKNEPERQNTNEAMDQSHEAGGNNKSSP